MEFYHAPHIYFHWWQYDGISAVLPEQKIKEFNKLEPFSVDSRISTGMFFI